MRLLIFIFLVLSTANTYSQDSLTVLSFNEYMARVQDHHPMIVQADLQTELGEAKLRKARGAFDPKLQADFDQKQFKGSEYYQHFNGGLTIPTWFGVKVKAGYEQNEGLFLNPEQSTPAGGLLYAGIELPVGQGLFIDERRAELRRARLYQRMTEAERQIMYNELLFEAGEAYWNWYNAFHNYIVYREAFEIATQRLNNIIRSAELGDLPAIDTVEATIQVQNRALSLNEAQLEYKNTRLKLSVYLWNEGLIPLEVPETTIPIDNDPDIVEGIRDSLWSEWPEIIAVHPAIRKYRLKAEQQAITKQWRAEQLKPELNLKYNALTEQTSGNVLEGYTANNYTWGLQFNFPLFLRKARGDLRLADLDLQQTQLDIQMAEAKLSYEANAALNKWQTYLQQIELNEQTVNNYQRLLYAERRLFEIGESSLFMINSREIAYINARIKLNEMLAKSQVAQLKTKYTLAQLE